jgi:pimeloyl-ACP methyl ester carboxylesterase
MRRRGRVLIGLLAAAITFGATAAPSEAALVDQQVTFDVQNVNRTPFPCTTDGLPYRVVGHIVGPASALQAQKPAATLYLHGAVLGEQSWRFNAVPGYDYALDEAARGHVSVTVDQLGYGNSDIPPGAFVCAASQADVAHQIVEQLRAGTYQTSGGFRPAFGRIALFGFSFGGHIAEIEALSFSDVDALVVESWADELSNAADLWVTQEATPVCGRGGDPKRPGGPLGYTYLFHVPDEHWMLFRPETAVRDALFRLHERDPCAFVESRAEFQATQALLREITVPVLLVYGRQDATAPPNAGDQHVTRFSGSSDVTLDYIENAGHFLALEKRAPEFRRVVSGWLRDRGY